MKEKLNSSAKSKSPFAKERSLSVQTARALKFNPHRAGTRQEREMNNEFNAVSDCQ